MNVSENERVFEPLFLALAKMDLSVEERNHVAGNYMFMFVDKEKGVFAYKHTWSRHYVYLSETGYVQDGEIDIAVYHPTQP